DTPGSTGPDTPTDNPPKTTPIDEHQIEVQVVSALGKPVAGTDYDLRLPDGSTKWGETARDGFLRFSDLPAGGSAKLVLPEHDAEKGSTQGAHTSGAMKYRAGGIDVQIGQSTVVEVEPRIYRGRLTGVLFDTDRTFVTPGALDGMRLIKRLYDEHPDSQVLVNGHADSVGAPAKNRDLSSERAESMAAFLTDDIDAWMAWYRGKPASHKWGSREDQYMLTTIVDGAGAPYYAGPVGDAAGPDAVAATKRYQTDRGLTVDGIAGDQTRRALVGDYMGLDGTSLPAGTVMKTHGCGESHPADGAGDNTADADNRRVEVFLFEGPIDPEPVASCPVPGGCSQYAEWVGRTVQTIDLEKAPGTISATVTDTKSKALEDVAVHASGPTSATAMTGGDGRATLADLAPGHYVVIARLDKFEDESVETDVSEDGVATVSLELRPTIDWDKFGFAMTKHDEPVQREPISEDAPEPEGDA
ncbi:MAG: carboxypeptidase regulatory-like domain-containing protein, partial [Deltaproteobacteria bacterium]|nr:carboxypeptidase regulatory-like domain-containing protein [Deltaproteobacteria bacterium]